MSSLTADPRTIALDTCPARSIAKCTGSIGATYDEGIGNTHVYVRATNSCTVCAPAAPSAADAKRAALATVTALDALHTAVEDASGFLAGRADLLADVEYATRIALRVRKALSDAIAAEAAAE